ncbi:hypothetical protein [Streptomyces narbonensis]|uniref:hypothetical protein n=1 Tax=Streptomyces narbonensis TaxID=67333 RepID=UPI001671BB8E|nr:hypothetical protein [Streptomyces narbonensis]GGV93909.1 hypothetical protein GCM10010230_05870 [Streptomyces narbonensis]
MTRRSAAAALRRRAAAATGRRAAAVALAGLLPLVAACGIQGSDVVEAGGAPTVLVAPNPESRMMLYFVGPDGRSMPVARDVGFGSSDNPFGPDYVLGSGDGHETAPPDKALLAERGAAGDKALAALLAGPNDAETAAGLTTGLPSGLAAPHVTEDKPAGTEGRRLLRARAPFPVTGLSETAVRQLVCTTVYAQDRFGLAEVVLIGPDGALPAATCDDDTD